MQYSSESNESNEDSEDIKGPENSKKENFRQYIPDDEDEDLEEDAEETDQDGKGYDDSSEGQENTQEDSEADIEIEEQELKEFDEEKKHNKKKYKEYTKEEWKEILQDFNGKDEQKKQDASQKFENALGGLPNAIISNEYRSYAAKYHDDLYQCGWIGILKAMKSFDPEKASVSTWCIKFIRHEMRDFINENIQCTTAHFRDTQKKVNSYGLETPHSKEFGNASIADIAINEGTSMVTIKESIEISSRRNSQISIDTPVGEGQSKVADLISSNYDSPEQALIKKERKLEIKKLMEHTLTEDEVTVIRLRYGFGKDENCEDNEEMSMAKIAVLTNIPTQNIRRMINNAEEKLRQAFMLNDDFDEHKKESRKSHGWIMGGMIKDEAILKREYDSFDFSTFEDVGGYFDLMNSIMDDYNDDDDDGKK
jgi:RNA polymerase sigma factor (sigma-70 family)